MNQRNSKLLLATALLVGWNLFFGSLAWATDKAGCKDPSWAAARLPGYQIQDCAEKNWMSMTVSLPAGEKVLEGHRSTVDYELVDQSKNATNAAAWQYFVVAAKKSGATLASNPAGGWSAELTRQTPQGTFWYMYKHGGGNDMSTDSFTLTTVQIAPLPQEVQAQAITGAMQTQGTACKDPPWLVKQFSYFKLTRCSSGDLDAITLDLPEGSKTLAGPVLRANYELTDPSKNPAALVVWKNYVNALQKIGAKLVSRNDNFFKAALTQHTPQGEYWYIYEHGSGNDDSTESYELTTLQVGGPAPKACKLEIYGVNFDFNKAILRPDSEPVLNQVLALFTHDPTYSAEIGGHTDNIGNSAYNRKLSAARADAVKDWLIAHGVTASRLSTAGYGDTRPLVPNTSDENRARNRRVELKRIGCNAK